MTKKIFKIVIVFLIISCSNLHLKYNMGMITKTQPGLSLSNTIESIPKNETNIILMIGDGMGFEHLKLASWVEFGKNAEFPIEELRFKKNVTTHNMDNEITDSAAAATAIATGHKTQNGYLSMLPNSRSVKTILELSRAMGKATGLISKTEITHATPAAFMTHVSSRDDTVTIANQIVEDSGVDILMGGGFTHFSTSQIEEMESKGYSVVRNKTKLQNINTGKIFGLFADDYLPYEIRRDYNITPSLAEMTEKAIEILSQSTEGFFLMVEGGMIDHAAHSSNKVRLALETIDFYHAFEVALSFISNNENSLLILTADHETGGLNVINETLNDELPSINKTFEENEDLRIARATNITVSWSTTGHTNRNVPIYASRLNSPNFENLTTIDNTDIFRIMYDYLGLNGKKPIILGLIIGLSIGAAIITSVVLFFVIKKRNRS
ncbi:MAG: alkaline phosphatase [Candidatus Thorarchaeota archaeon]